VISVVTICNNEKVMDDCIGQSLRAQTSEHEFILLDNSNGIYKCAAEALNEGCGKARGNYIMCVHQDVELAGYDFLEKAEAMLDGLENAGVAGVAGMSLAGASHLEKRRNIIYQGYPERHLWGNEIKRPEEVQTVDECLLIMPANVFTKIQFDEKSCDDWHLYGVDYCLSVQEAGLKAYVLPLQIYHRSMGSSALPSNTFLRLGSKTPAYYRSLGKVLKKHKNFVSEITTTCGDWNTSYPVLLQRMYHFIKYRMPS
jgi:GT2 family glycosyltransferase